MFLRKYKPTSPARRSEKRINVAPLGVLLRPKLIPSRVVRGFGRKKQNHKPLYYPSTKYYNTVRDYIYQDVNTYCTSLFRPTYSNCFIACITTGDGLSYYMKAYNGLGLGIPIDCSTQPFLTRVSYNLGSMITLIHTQTGAMCFSLIVKSARGWKIAESAGTFCKILWHDYKQGHTVMRLPSKKLARMDLMDTCRLGRSANVDQSGTVYGSARSGLNKRNKTFKVRGVAMNPVDHPNGGRTNTKRPLMNPWGRPAKKGK